ncbi:MAG TPA: translation initiation factor IF-3 [Saprospiraceae bacterium]|nr:translation initiation factor IF-3 [Saprospiraceae bacterium]HQW55131.1 translation initiation factor IF-3 [Saprospiraceae bacterium]
MAKSRQPRQEQVQEKNLYRINEDIRIPEVRLVGENLEEISEVAGQPLEPGVYSTRLLMDWANKAGLDLVEISPNAKPPVVKIIDYQKFLYNKKKKDRELKAKTVKTVIKEIRFGPNTDDHDFEFKVKHAKGFLEEGAKVRAFVQFRGRSIVFQDRGELLLLKFLKELEEYGAAESLPKLEGKRMGVMLAPKKSAKAK